MARQTALRGRIAIAAGSARHLFVHALGGLVLATAVAASADGAMAAGPGEPAQLPARKAIAAPQGFAGVCDRYGWACARTKGSTAGSGQHLTLAKSVNSAINRKYRQVSDQKQYGTAEVWALPTARGGDCEDFVLAKKLRLIEKGIPAERLLMATVLDTKRSPHAVLVLRLDAGDYVLDNLKDQIKPWHKTGYSFLMMQNPRAPQSWEAVLAGGVFAGRRL